MDTFRKHFGNAKNWETYENEKVSLLDIPIGGKATQFLVCCIVSAETLEYRNSTNVSFGFLRSRIISAVSMEIKQNFVTCLS